MSLPALPGSPLHLFKYSTAGKHRPPLRDLPKVNRGYVIVGTNLYGRARFTSLREAAARKQIFDMHKPNVIS